MSRTTPFSSPLLLGFDAMEKTLERLAKNGDSYPPYNIERLRNADGVEERLRITLAVAGFQVLQAVPFFGQGVEGFGGELVSGGMNGHFAGPGAEEIALDSHKIAQVKILVELLV